jgi:hypothetical protein
MSGRKEVPIQKRSNIMRRHSIAGHHHAHAPWDSTPVAALIGLYAMTLGVVLALILPSCGMTPPPSGYVWMDKADLVYLTWNNQHGNLSGTVTSVSYTTPAFTASPTSDVSSFGYHGTLSSTSVLLHLSTLFDPTISGTLSGNGQTLTLGVPDATSGQMRQETWVAVTPQQETALLAAFNANEVARGMLPVVEQDAGGEPSPWTVQNAGGIAEVQSQVQNDQAMLTAIQQAHDETTQCQDVHAFQDSNLLTSASFAFAYAIGDAPLMTHLASLEQAWKQVQAHPIPQIAGLPKASLAWVLTPAQYQTGTQRAVQLAAQITRSKAQDTQQLHALRQQYQAILHTEQAIAASCSSAKP